MHVVGEWRDKAFQRTIALLYEEMVKGRLIFYEEADRQSFYTRNMFTNSPNLPLIAFTLLRSCSDPAVDSVTSSASS